MMISPYQSALADSEGPTAQLGSRVFQSLLQVVVADRDAKLQAELCTAPVWTKGPINKRAQAKMQGSLVRKTAGQGSSRQVHAASNSVAASGARL